MHILNINTYKYALVVRSAVRRTPYTEVISLACGTKNGMVAATKVVEQKRLMGQMKSRAGQVCARNKQGL